MANVITYSLKSQGSTKLTDYFKVSEFKCKDGSDQILIDVDFVKDKLNKIRNWAKNPVNITSGYRTPAYNKKIGGATNSYHIKGQAFDIVVSGKTLDEVCCYAESIGILGIIKYPNSGFVHVDSRTSRYFSNDGGKSSCTTFGDDLSSLSGGQINFRDLQKAAVDDKITDKNNNLLKLDGLYGELSQSVINKIILKESAPTKYPNCTAWLQCRLNVPVTYTYDKTTADAVAAYQSEHGLSVDRIAGKDVFNTVLRTMYGIG